MSRDVRRGRLEFTGYGEGWCIGGGGGHPWGLLCSLWVGQPFAGSSWALFQVGLVDPTEPSMVSPGEGGSSGGWLGTECDTEEQAIAIHKI